MLFTVFHSDESVGDFHQRALDGVTEPTIWLPTIPTHPTLVLGSRQNEGVLDLAACEQRNVTVVKRRSGGGAVLVSAHDLVWMDVLVTRNHPGWDDDVRRSFRWLSECLLVALNELGVDGTAHVGSMINTQWSDLICFAGLGPGEITVDGRKLVGISQRRTRNVARFQVAILRAWDPDAMFALFDLDDATRERGVAAIADAGCVIDAPPAAVIDAVTRALG